LLYVDIFFKINQKNCVKILKVERGRDMNELYRFAKLILDNLEKIITSVSALILALTAYEKAKSRNTDEDTND